MSSPIAPITQTDFAGGMFRGRQAPRNSVYDAVNVLVNDERELFRRGATAYESNANVAATLLGIADMASRFGQRTLMWQSGIGAYSLNGATPVAVNHTSITAQLLPFARAAQIGAMIAIPIDGALYGNSGVLLWAGARKPPMSTGSRTVTNGSRTVTGVGTNWLTTADPGWMVFSGSPLQIGVVQTVVSDTQLTLVDPFTGATGTSSGVGVLNTFGEVRLQNFDASAVATDPVFPAAAGRRLLLGSGSRVYFSEPDSPMDFTSLTTGDQFHEIPGGGIVGQEGVGTSSIVFTTTGIWVIANLDLDPVDAQGNVQHQVQLINQDVILWGDPGIAAWGGQTIVPALDDVYLMSLASAPFPISSAIRPLYRGYVAAGYRPGTASVHRGHYILPIVNSSNVTVDELVCRLDLRDSRGNIAPAWTRWDSHAACGATAARTSGSTRQPKLLGVNGPRVVDLTGAFSVPTTELDATGLVPQATVDSQDFVSGDGLRPGHVDRVRVQCELAGAFAPTMNVYWATGAEGAAFTAAPVVRGGGVTDGTGYSAWEVKKRLTRVRVRVQLNAGSTKFILREIQVRIRPSGRD